MNKMKKWCLYLICYGLGIASLWLVQTALRSDSQTESAAHTDHGPISLLYFMRLNFGALTCHELVPHISEEQPYNNYDVYDFSALMDKKAFQKMICEAAALSHERKCPMELWLPCFDAQRGKYKQWDNEQMFKFVANNCTDVRSLVVTASPADMDHIAKYFPQLETLTLLGFMNDSNGFPALLTPEKTAEQKLQLKPALQRLGKMKSLKYLLVVSGMEMWFSKEELQEALGNPDIQIFGDFS